MPRLIDPRTRVDDITAAVVHLLDTEGAGALSLRRIAGVLRLSPSTLLFHLDSTHRILDLVAKRLGDALVEELACSVRWRGMEAVVPDDDRLPEVRAWLGLAELARADADREAGVDRIRADLRAVIGHAAGLPHDDVGRDVLAALVHGLWVARCSRTAPMTEERGRQIVGHACAALGVGARPEPDAA